MGCIARHRKMVLHSMFDCCPMVNKPHVAQDTQRAICSRPHKKNCPAACNNITRFKPASNEASVETLDIWQPFHAGFLLSFGDRESAPTVGKLVREENS